uniref:Uncharacterized protein n=1 Tax=Steinernema glaseri TaxID=37863 RepID=A0A1I7ZZF5_9BILA
MISRRTASQRAYQSIDRGAKQGADRRRRPRSSARRNDSSRRWNFSVCPPLLLLLIDVFQAIVLEPEVEKLRNSESKSNKIFWGNAEIHGRTLNGKEEKEGKGRKLGLENGRIGNQKVQYIESTEHAQIHGRDDAPREETWEVEAERAYIQAFPTYATGRNKHNLKRKQRKKHLLKRKAEEISLDASSGGRRGSRDSARGDETLRVCGVSTPHSTNPSGEERWGSPPDSS